jgi:hypothetical protein
MLSVVSSPISGFPEELKRYRQWMATRLEPRKDGKVDKPPYRVREGQPIIKADKTDAANHASFEEAMLALERGDVDAIGYVFSGEDPLFCVDLDKVIDLETGEINQAAAEVIHAVGSYAEVSCSGRGVHIIGVGTKPEFARCKSRALGFEAEVYDRARFLLVTGHRFSADGKVRECEKELEALCRKLWPKKPRTPRGPVGYSHRATLSELEDAELLERARNSRSGPKFRKLFDVGDTSGSPSASEADFSLLNMLIFWCAGDAERVARLFEGSALYRKEKGRGYVGLSVANALKDYVGAFYKPRSVNKVRQEEEQDPLTPYLKLLLDPSQWTGRKGASAFKTYAGAVALAAEHGIFDDEGNVRIGCDTRRLAEAAGTRQATVCESGLPTLAAMKLLRWKRGKGTKSGSFLLPSPGGRTERITKVATHFSDTGYAPPKNALEILRLLVRMRTGHSNHVKVLRLGMPAMFVTVALSTSPRRGQSLTELAQSTGRRERVLRDVLKKLKAAGIARETSEGLYRLTDEYAAAYERHLDLSGITYAERAQRRAHEKDRERRAAGLPTDQRTERLRGPEQTQRLLKKRREEEACRKAAAASREASPDTRDETREKRERRIQKLIGEGMSEKWARDEVLGTGWLP